MKYRHLIPSLSAACLLLATLACGSTQPAEPIIETAAKDMNLTAADLGFDWSLTGEQGVDEMEDISEEDVLDANLRMFASTELTGMVMSIVFSTESVSSAQQEMGDVTAQDLGADMEAQLPGLTFETLDPPAVGDEAVAIGGNYADLNMNVYVMAFRKTNVIVIFSLMGAEESVNENLLADYAQKLEARIR